MVLTTPKQIKDADLQVFCQQAVVAVSGYFYAVNLRPEVHPQHHYVGKDRRCTCGLGADCPAVLAVPAMQYRLDTVRMNSLPFDAAGDARIGSPRFSRPSEDPSASLRMLTNPSFRARKISGTPSPSISSTRAATAGTPEVLKLQPFSFEPGVNAVIG